MTHNVTRMSWRRSEAGYRSRRLEAVRITPALRGIQGPTSRHDLLPLLDQVCSASSSSRVASQYDNGAESNERHTEELTRPSDRSHVGLPCVLVGMAALVLDHRIWYRRRRATQATRRRGGPRGRAALPDSTADAFEPPPRTSPQERQRLKRCQFSPTPTGEWTRYRSGQEAGHRLVHPPVRIRLDQCRGARKATVGRALISQAVKSRRSR
jgi:hypothetical protein